MNEDWLFRLWKLLSNPEVQSGFFFLEKHEREGRRRRVGGKWGHEKERIQNRLRVLFAEA